MGSIFSSQIKLRLRLNFSGEVGCQDQLADIMKHPGDESFHRPNLGSSHSAWAMALAVAAVFKL